MTALTVEHACGGGGVSVSTIGGPSPSSGGPAPSLTARQSAVLRLIANGATQPAVAAGLRISEAAVGNELKAIRRELGARNTVHAVAVALRLGLLRPNEVALPAAPDRRTRNAA